MRTVEVVVTRPLMALLSPWAKGARLKVEPMVASQLIASGRAELVNAADQVVLTDAESRHALVACRIDPAQRRFRN